MVQPLVTGIDFIGGGAILKSRGSVKGTATAASIWTTGLIGIAVAGDRFEIAAFMSSHDSGMVISNDLGTFAATDSTRFRTFSVGANYHFSSDGRAQWSLGGFVPWIYVDPTDHVFSELNRTEHRYYDQDYGLGVKGGLDWSFAADSPWTLTIEGRYMALLIMESETVGDVDVDPLVLSIGIGYRF